MMLETTPRTTYLKDYAVPAFLIDNVDLRFELGETDTRVGARLTIRRNPDSPEHGTDLVLDGGDLPLDGISLDGEALAPERYTLNSTSLTLHEVPDAFVLETHTRLRPQDNTSLEGLYKSSGNFCTQCEAQGFRKITWYPDRPDVMARFTTTVVAERRRYPVLLSNGNPVERGEMEDGRHWVRWEDPYPKPCYLFALVAGDLVCIEDHHTTASGREVALRIYVEAHNRDRCAHAMASLKKAMRWDKARFGREYDLDIYMIVAVDDFNMGAMENKGLNVFNSKYVLARPETATDADYAAIEGVIAHEYFHNWTGNRVTCRDWFQLSLKEGLTVFRDQEFSSDMESRAVKRIEDVRVLRDHQFPEDAGPMAHPVRPASYIEISNFYTVTVYNKGAEVIRMIHTLLGAEGFRAGMDLYFERHDGQAVTTEDFVSAMEDATGTDLRRFRHWYDQAGTPVVTVRGTYDAQAQRYTLSLRQHCPATPGQSDKAPFHIPLDLALLDADGRSLPLRLVGEPPHEAPPNRVFNLTEAEQQIVFEDVASPPVLSINRGFSAPIRVEFDRDDAELAFLLGHDDDPFSRWDASQCYAERLILRMIERAGKGRLKAADPAFIEAFQRTLTDSTLDPALRAEALALPAEGYLAERMTIADPDAIHQARQALRGILARELAEPLTRVYHDCLRNAPYRFEPQAVARRSLKNLCLGYQMETGTPEPRAACIAQLQDADNMTDALAALRMLANSEGPERIEALAAFEQRWHGDPLVLDKWFALQATARLPGTLDEVRRLMAHPNFDLRNPNRVRALIGAFCHGNPLHFHAADGSGYRFLTEQVLAIDSFNPQIAARLLGAFGRWRRYDTARQGLMHSELEAILGTDGLSRDSYEVASKLVD